MKIACVTDGSSHGGAIITSGADDSLVAGGDIVAVDGALHQCSIPVHGTTPVTAITTKTFHNGKLVLTEGAVAGCGAVIIALGNRNVYVE